MGNPLRLFGADQAFEIDGVVIPPRCAVEVTFRTQQQRFLLRPERETNELLLGCLSCGYDRYASRVTVLYSRTFSFVSRMLCPGHYVHPC